VNDGRKGLLIFIAIIVFFAYQAFSIYQVNKTDPDLKEGVRCLIEQLAEHRIGSRGADDAAAQHHGYQYNPNTKAGYDEPPTPSGRPVCEPFLKED
jgi:hypothetical protein